MNKKDILFIVLILIATSVICNLLEFVFIDTVMITMLVGIICSWNLAIKRADTR